MKDIASIGGYKFDDEQVSHTNAYLFPPLVRELKNHFAVSKSNSKQIRLFDLGCGNGGTAAELAKLGYDVVGVDPSQEGIEIAHRCFPELSLHYGSAYDDLKSLYGEFDAVISLEVVEHVYAPREYAKTLYSLVGTNGIAIVSTPYHGYLKNLVMAASGKLDAHFTALWDHGHIKFWSIQTLSELLMESGFSRVRFLRVGRIPVLAKSMIAIAYK